MAFALNCYFECCCSRCGPVLTRLCGDESQTQKLQTHNKPTPYIFYGWRCSVITEQVFQVFESIFTTTLLLQTNSDLGQKQHEVTFKLLFTSLLLIAGVNFNSQWCDQVVRAATRSQALLIGIVVRVKHHNKEPQCVLANHICQR